MPNKLRGQNKRGARKFLLKLKMGGQNKWVGGGGGAEFKKNR